MSTRSGPPLAPLLRRLLDTPGDFLLEPRVEGKKGVSGELHVDALVSDTLRWMGGPPLSTVQGAALRRGESAAEKNALRLASITAWLLCDSAFKGRREGVPAARRLLLEELRGLAGVIRPGDCVTALTVSSGMAHQVNWSDKASSGRAASSSDSRWYEQFSSKK